MFPFTLTGSEFLIFYALLCAAVIAGLVVWRRSKEAGEDARVNLSDPYLIACLRGGSQEAVRVAVVSLVDRGLLRLTASSCGASCGSSCGSSGGSSSSCSSGSSCGSGCGGCGGGGCGG